MFNLANDFLIGLGIYIAIIVFSLSALFFTLKRYKNVNKPPILHTVLLFINYTWLIIALTMSYFGVWMVLTSISLVYLLSLAPLFKIFFISKYYHLKAQTTYYRNIYWLSVVYLVSIPILVVALLVF